MDFLKNVFGGGALTYEQFVEKVNAAENIQLINLADGGYVGKGEHDALQARFNSVNGQLTAANQKLAGYDPEWQAKAEKAKQEADSRVQQIEFDYALGAALTAARARNATAVKALLNMDGLKLSDGRIVGLNEQLDTLRKENDYLFESEQQTPRFSAAAPGIQGGASDKKTQLNDALRSALGKQEQ